MRPFRYEQAADPAAAVALLAAEPGAAFLGGGTNLVDLMKLEVERPDVLVDVRGAVPAAVEALPGGGVRIGAGVTMSDLAVDPVLRAAHGVVADALLSGATYQLRNLATIGGNLLQRTRCVYFQDVSRPCNKRAPGSGCSAREGHHRGLAVLGASEACVATHPSDLAVALAALDAVVHVTGPRGDRAIPLVDFHRLPGDEPQRDTVLERGELIVAVDLPAFGGRALYRKVRERASYSFAVVSVAATLEAGTFRIALGGVAHKPWRATRAEAALAGGRGFAEAADAELEQADPLPDNAFKVPLARRVLVRALEELAG